MNINEQLLRALYQCICHSNTQYFVDKDSRFVYELTSKAKFIFPVYYDEILKKFKLDRDYNDFVRDKLQLERGRFSFEEFCESVENIEPELIRKEYVKQNSPTVDIFKPNKIGLGVDPVYKPKKIYAADVLTDDVTTAKKSQQSHILYAAGWRLDHK